MIVCTNFAWSINTSLVNTLPFLYVDTLEEKSIWYRNNSEDDINNNAFCEDIPKDMTIDQVSYLLVSLATWSLLNTKYLLKKN